MGVIGMFFIAVRLPAKGTGLLINLLFWPPLVFLLLFGPGPAKILATASDVLPIIAAGLL